MTDKESINPWSICFNTFDAGILNVLTGTTRAAGLANEKTACLLSVDLWPDLIADAETLSYMTYSDHVDAVRYGYLGKLLGVRICTDGYRDEVARTLDPGEVFVGPVELIRTMLKASTRKKLLELAKEATLLARGYRGLSKMDGAYGTRLPNEPGPDFDLDVPLESTDHPTYSSLNSSERAEVTEQLLSYLGLRLARRRTYDKHSMGLTDAVTTAFSLDTEP